jgi:Fe-S-cluster-containing dehydrogenase component/DMSO reductase anchor subunit
MAEGFIFNHNKCVGCGACSAACMLENKWSYRTRMIYTRNPIALPSLPVINLSLACNHCKKAVCMEGCPASSYYREPCTGAVVIDDTKCIGCRYCQWNCPYDAPKYPGNEKVIGKCNFCYQRLNEGLMPACSTSCPTGALKYGKLDEQTVAVIIPWFPDKSLEPAIELTGGNDPILRIIPQNIFDDETVQSQDKRQEGQIEWSLIAFSFLTTLSVAHMISALIAGIYPDKIKFLSVLVMAGLLSLFHLGKKGRAWRAVLNFKHSPLSREIALFIIYSLLAGLSVLIQLPVLLILSSVAGLVVLVAIDAVYLFADKRKSVFLHSGQTFITGLLIISFLTGKILPFIFIAIVKLITSVKQIGKSRDDSIRFVVRFVRMALLIITGISLISGISYPEIAVICLFIAGELLDRILFYIDFKPLNIVSLINSPVI